MKLNTLFLISMIVLLTITGCGSPTPTVAPSPETTEMVTEEITVVDALGRTVTFAEPPQRIVIAGKANFMLNDAVYLFPQAQERIVALTRASQDLGFLGVIEPQAEEKVRFAVDSSAEELAAAQPDLVLLKSFMSDQVGASLEELDIPVVYLDLETPEQYIRDIGILGTIFDDPERAEEIIDFYQTRLDEIESSLTGVDDDAKPDVLVLQYDNRSEEIAFKVPPPTWIQTWMATFAGGNPVWEMEGGGWTIVNLEQIAAWDPDEIYVIAYFANVDEVVEQLTQDPLWEPLSAVQNGRVFAFPKDYYSWDQPDTRWILGVTWLAKTLHPEALPEVEVMETMRTFYSELYGLDEETINQEILPQLQGDVQR